MVKVSTLKLGRPSPSSGSELSGCATGRALDLRSTGRGFESSLGKAA